jgi:hypothetical protein
MIRSKVEIGLQKIYEVTDNILLVRRVYDLVNYDLEKKMKSWNYKKYQDSLNARIRKNKKIQTILKKPRNEIEILKGKGKTVLKMTYQKRAP